MFRIYKRALGDVEPFEYLPGAEGLALGSAVEVASGQLAKCAATDKLVYIIAGVKRADGNYPVIRVLNTTIFEADASGAVEADKLATTLQMNAEADGLTTTAGGAFTVTWADGGTVVRGYFEPAAASV